MDYVCVSVVGGWKTAIRMPNSSELVKVNNELFTFGPTFHKINDLWNWQKQSL
jgi:hypothetical protein